MIKFNLKQFEDSTDSSTVRAAVLAMLAHIVIYPLFGLVFLLVDKNFNDNYFDRLLSSIPSMALLLLLLFNNRSRKYSQLFAAIAAMVANGHVMWLLYLNHLNTVYCMGYFVLITIVSALLVQISCIVLFSAFILTGSILVAVLTPKPEVHPLLFYGWTFCECGFAALINIQKLRGYHQVEKQKERLIEADRLASVGILAAGVAHEFNNPLAIIDGRASILMRKIEKEQVDFAEFSGGLSRIREAVARLSEIVKSLLEISSNTTLDSNSSCSALEAIRHAQKFVGGQISDANIRLIVPPSDLDYQINGTLMHYSQVLISLISNSIEALAADKGHDKWIEIQCKESSPQYLQIFVTDSGKGLPEDVANKIFFPFFTTKEPGAGIGLGLNLAKMTMEKVGATLSYSTESKNTQFKIEAIRR